MPFTQVLSGQAPFLLPLWEHAIFSLPFLLFISLATLGWLILAGRQKARILKRSSYDKGAKQLTTLGCLGGWFLVLASKGLLFYQTGSWLPTDFVSFQLEILWILLGLTVLLLNLHLALWKNLGQHPTLLASFAWLTGLQGFFTATLFFGLSRILAGHYPLPDLQRLASFETLSHTFLPPNFGPPYAALLAMPFLLLAGPYVFGSLGFIFLRNLQDFGRDHYTIVLNWSAQKARNFGLAILAIFTGSLGWQIYTALEAGFDPQALAQKFWPELSVSGLWLLAVLVYSLVAKSRIPMRHRFLLGLADLLALASLPIWFECWLG